MAINRFVARGPGPSRSPADSGVLPPFRLSLLLCLASTVAGLGLMSGCGASGGEWESQSQPAGILEVPFGFERNQIALDVELNGTGPLRMLLDTGVDPSAVDLSTALEVGIPVDLDSAGVAEGVGSERSSVYSATIKSLRIGGWPFGDLPAAAFSIPTDAYRLPLEFVDEGVFIPRVAELRVDGRVIPVSLDTGCSLTVELFAGVVAELGLEQAAADARSASVRGARGHAEVKVLRFDSVGLGPVTVSPLEGRVADRAGKVFFELPKPAVTAGTPVPEGLVAPRPLTEGESHGS